MIKSTLFLPKSFAKCESFSESNQYVLGNPTSTRNQIPTINENLNTLEKIAIPVTTVSELLQHANIMSSSKEANSPSRFGQRSAAKSGLTKHIASDEKILHEAFNQKPKPDIQMGFAQQNSMQYAANTLPVDKDIVIVRDTIMSTSSGGNAVCRKRRVLASRSLAAPQAVHEVDWPCSARTVKNLGSQTTLIGKPHITNPHHELAEHYQTANMNSNLSSNYLNLLEEEEEEGERKEEEKQKEEAQSIALRTENRNDDYNYCYLSSVLCEDLIDGELPPIQP
jgi:hypothetical protein